MHSTGTVNHMFRLGDDLAVRVPRCQEWAADLDKELDLLPRLAPAGARHLPLALPQPLAAGVPGPGVPLRWAVYRWLPGVPYSDDLVRDEGDAAEDLAAFVLALRSLDASDGPAGGRKPLRHLDTQTREALRASHGIDVPAALTAWDRALDAPPWHGVEPVWVHADLLRPNLLVVDGKLSAVIDVGSMGVGDPAADVIAAWSVFGQRGRAAYLAALGGEPATIERGRGYALHQAALIIPYYATTNPGLAEHARRTIAQVIDDVR